MKTNLKATLTKYDIKIKEFATEIDVAESTASLKANDKAIITTEEVFKVQKMIYKKTGVKLSFEEILNCA